MSLLIALAAATQLAIVPWTGKDLQATTTTAVKYRLTVTGKPATALRLSASHVASGWLAAFCTPTVCAPMRVDVTLPESGTATFQFELIKEDDKAPTHSGAIITTSDGTVLTVKDEAGTQR